jgi:proteasome accessory factor B
MQPLERLVNLVALLLEARTPLTFEQIREKLSEAYGHRDVNSAKRMFERDKDVLRDVGVPIEVGSTDVWEADQGYTIPKDRYYLPEIRFTPEEIGALAIAARSGGDATAEDAVRKLLSGAEGGMLASLGGVAGYEGGADPRLPAAAEAVAGLRRVGFTYRTARGESSERVVDAYGLAVRGGRWYLVGFDVDRGEIRSFRLTRLSSDLSDRGPGSEPPAGFRAADAVQAGPAATGESRATAVVALAPDAAWWAMRGIPDAEETKARDDGWVEVRVPWQPGESLADWVLSFGPDAEAIEPAELREEVVRRLEAALAVA